MSQFHTLALSSAYLEELLNRYRVNPSEVPPDWRATLDILSAYFPSVLSKTESPGHAPLDFIRRFAHLAARLDPLDRELPARWETLRSEFASRLAEAGLDPAERAAAALMQTYAGTLAVETGHIDDARRVAWIESRRETSAVADTAARRRALAAIVQAETFERFMGTRFPGKKRFGAEGAETLHAFVQRVLDRAASGGVEEVVIGTMHRGRLGLMANLFGQPLEQLFALMKGGYPLDTTGRAADVPYHLGLVSEHQAPAGRIKLRLLPNPSHLEAINAVALGYTRGRQDAAGSSSEVLTLILHTDASVVAQGVVAEALQLAEVPGHRVGGAINVIVNNQIGFTTEPDEGRSSRHSTAQWKAIDSLIAHVNGDDVDAVLAAADLAFDYRQHFAGESVVDLVCIRANGHNEVDEPRFTQPLYYQAAEHRTSIGARYAAALLGEKLIDPDFVSASENDHRTRLDAAFTNGGAAAASSVPSEPQAATSAATPPAAIVDLASRLPQDGQFNPKAARLVTQRAEEWRAAVSWATAEIMAIGTVLSMGWDVRLTGQDVERGAFSQRHLALFDIVSGQRRQVFESRPAGWGVFKVHNTPLSEYAALLFEYGYSVAAARTLTLWEAQFGDFLNGAQIALDQFIASGEEKWDQHSGLVILLPHGLEGQGPEHSSGRIERLLQLGAKNNLRIAHPSTPANYFHLLMSQVGQTPRRPLIVFTPKKLLRMKAATSLSSQFETGHFEPVLRHPAAGKARRTLLCSGKIYYDLAQTVLEQQIADVSIVRIEQLYPFPHLAIVEALRSLGGSEVIWVQEEPENYGAWSWIRARIEAALAQAGGTPSLLSCVARPESSSPAGSFHQDHDADQRRLVADAIRAMEVNAFSKPRRESPQPIL